MGILFAPLFSGSSGNATYVQMDSTRLLVDAGLSGARIEAEMKKFGADPNALDGILITHEHSDHISGVGVLSRRYDLPVYATQGTWDAMAAKIGEVARKNVRVLRAEEDFFIGEIDVTPFSLPHDAADPVGYALVRGGCRLTIATDIGAVRESWLKQAEGADALLLEANHDVNMLKAGRYPYELKRRILGKKGHLSNEDSGRAAAELAARGVRRIILGHLSEENNFPELALRTVADALDAAGFAPGADIELSVAGRRASADACVLRAGIGAGV